EAPGVGGVGQAFVDALRSQVGNRSVGVYAVNYAASSDFADRNGLALSVADGVRDEGAHIEAMAANCPNTRIVLGGYSQGAVVTGFTTADAAPSEVPASIAPKPLPPQVADHVAAVVLFGEPSPQFLQSYGAPPITIGGRYAPKTTALCAPGDTICDGTPNATPTVAHALYPVNGMTGQAASFVVGRL
ncbi:MAG: cutinase family protein, partial [Mycobacterium sp.]